MRLLIVTQAVDTEDSALAFFVRWIAEFAGKAEQVEVICLKEGTYALPTNVRVHSLGKEHGKHGKHGKVAYALRFLRLAWRLRRDYDAVFVHMNPEYVVLAGALWKAWHKRVVLWYTHRQVNLKLRTALFFVDAVATAAPESLRVATPKAHVVGHGIDVSRFETARDGAFHEPARIVSVGRITPIKRLEILLDALALLRTEGIRAEVSLVGAPTVPGDAAYQESLAAQASRLGISGAVHFMGAMPYDAMPEHYRQNDISVNLAPTGGIDKAVLESMASGCIPLVANRAFAPFFKSDADRLLFEPNPEALAEKLRSLIRMQQEERRALAARLSATARTEADERVIVARLYSLLLP